MKLSAIVNVIYLIGFLDLLAVSLTIPMLSKHVRELGASPTVAGLLSSLYGFLQLFSSPLVGKWSDFSGRKYVLLWCLLLSAAGYALLGVSSTILILLLARIPTGLFKHSQEIAKAYLADVTPVSEHSLVFGRFNSVSSIGFVFGPIIGGHLSEFENGFYLLSLITAMLFLLDMLLVLALLPGDGTVRTQSHQRNTEFEGFHPLVFLHSFNEVDWKKFWDIFLVRFLFSFSVLVYRSDFAATLNYKFHASAKITGYMISYAGVVGTIVGFFVGAISSRYKDDAKLLLHTGIMQTLTMCAMTFAPDVLTLALLMTPLSIANAVARVCAINLTLVRGDDSQKGMLMGLGASVLSLSRMTSPAVGGMSQEFSVSGPSILATIVSAIGVVVLLTARSRTSFSKKDT